ncbi:glucosamine-6-phosphate deaminase [Thraustotheca clavata]|uniref:Glucosamine-6-phosphate deaminase n=1 Tax=Thraustotheca clavata TaxID=74557 RepID=A0A1V9Y929_9STRA|nr:glucosamine-6-phosphate deaminase [Thraustotheca clavata]
MSMRGTCMTMCPACEVRERLKSKELSKYEQTPWEPVKRYRRAAAGTSIREEDVRPAPVLIETMKYLLRLLPNEFHLPLDLYHFLDDRFRAIRSDLILQGLVDMEILQPIARFYLLARCVLQYETQKSGNTVTYTSLQKLLQDQLYSVMYLVRSSSIEFERYYLWLHQDAADFSYQLRQIARYGQATWHETVGLCKPLSYIDPFPSKLQTNLFYRVILFKKLETSVHEKMLILAKAYTKQDRFPVAHLARYLNLDSEIAAHLVLEGYGISVTRQEGLEPAFFRFNEVPLPSSCHVKSLHALEELEFHSIEKIVGAATFAQLLQITEIFFKMRLIIEENATRVGEWVAAYVVQRIKCFEPTSFRPFVLGLPTGSSPLPTYKRLIELFNKGMVSFEHVVTFNMDEYVNLPRDHPESYHSFMWSNFFSHIDIKRENVHILNGNASDLELECVEYEKKILSFGGIELFLGGIGPDGHIAFNEPGSSLSSRTRVKTLAYDTIVANSRFFGGDLAMVPKMALTVGVGTVMDAREVLIIITGHSKAYALYKCIEEGVNHMWTVSTIQLHTKAVIVCDEDATLELKVKTGKTDSMEQRGREESKRSADGDRKRSEGGKKRSGEGDKKRSREEESKKVMDRRKIQKYKDDKLKERREHTRKVLEQQAQEKRRVLLGRQSEFLGTLEFRNTLPDVPFDAKFLQYPSDPMRFVKYKPNQLEKDFVWEFYPERNLGLVVDLIDPEKYEVPTMTKRIMDPEDLELIKMPEVVSGSGISREKIRPHVSWLRRTEYMGTDLSESVHKFKNESELQEEMRDRNQSMLSVIMQKDLETRANESFENCPTKDTVVHPLNKNLKPVQVWDVFPDEVLSSNVYSILSYDILPSDEAGDKTVKERESRSILRNVVTVSQPGSDVLLGSILFPSTRDAENTSSEKFKFFRDYILNISHFPNDVQQLILMLNPNSESATYCSLSTNIMLKKTKVSFLVQT